MQNPDARPGIAWWRPPPGWKACSTSPRRIASTARSEPPAAAASCIPGERRVVAEGCEPGFGLAKRVRRQSLDRREVAGGVDLEELGLVGRLGCEAGNRPNRPEQVDPGPEATRRERVAGTEVIGRRAWAEDEERAGRHVAHRSPGRGTIRPWPMSSAPDP